MIATVTMNPSLQYMLQVDALPVNQVVPAKGTLSAIGGTGINTARLIRQLDPQAQVSCLGLLGGHLGAWIKQQLDAEQVPHDFSDTGLEPRADVTITLTPDRSQVRIRAAGPEAELDHAKDVEKRLGALDPAPSYVLLGGGLPGRELPPRIPREWYAELIAGYQAKNKDLRFVLDAPRLELGHAVERGPWLVKPSLAELEQLSGRKGLSDDKEIVAAAEDLMGRYNVRHFVVTLGREGAVALTDKARYRVYSPEVQALSSTGAGAAMLAGLLYGLDTDKTFEEALKLGAAAGAARAATRSSALPSGDEIRALVPQARIEGI